MKVSVIIPIYNVAAYIARCVRSLLGQTLDDVEFIFVDDCSSDDSIFILEAVIKEFPKRAETIKLIRHSQNMGLPAARNSGLEMAEGEYIFIAIVMIGLNLQHWKIFIMWPSKKTQILYGVIGIWLFHRVVG